MLGFCGILLDALPNPSHYSFERYPCSRHVGIAARSGGSHPLQGVPLFPLVPEEEREVPDSPHSDGFGEDAPVSGTLTCGSMLIWMRRSACGAGFGVGTWSMGSLKCQDSTASTSPMSKCEVLTDGDSFGLGPRGFATAACLKVKGCVSGQSHGLR